MEPIDSSYLTSYSTTYNTFSLSNVNRFQVISVNTIYRMLRKPQKFKNHKYFKYAKFRGLRGLKCGSRTRPVASMIDPHPPFTTKYSDILTRNNSRVVAPTTRTCQPAPHRPLNYCKCDQWNPLI